VILAGGKGARLAPYTAVFPKPLVPLGEKPIIDILVNQLARAGFTDLVFSVGHLAELIIAYFADHPLRQQGVTLRWVREQTPLGTAGSLTLIEDLPPQFLVLNGDILTTLDFGRLFDSHLSSGADLTIATYAKLVPIPLGVVDQVDGRVIGYTEKPVLSYEASMGVYAYSRSALEAIPKGRPFDLPDLVHELMRLGRRVEAYHSDAEWLDIGNPEDYSAAQKAFEASPGLYISNSGEGCP
jgi:NDP-sugar pyrophosphorylase family protein